MKLASTSNPAGLQFVEEFVYAYNGTGAARAVGDVCRFEMEDTALDYNVVGTITSPWSLLKTPTAQAVTASFMGIIMDTTIANNALAKVCVRNQIVAARQATVGAITKSWIGIGTNGAHQLTFSATPVGTAKALAFLLTASYTAAANDLIDCVFDGINGLR